MNGFGFFQKAGYGEFQQKLGVYMRNIHTLRMLCLEFRKEFQFYGLNS